MRICLKNGGFELGLAPLEGGCVTHFTWQSQHLLRPAPPARDDLRYDPLEFAAFPLVPFSGRIDQGRFEVGPDLIHLAANMPPEQHAIHGHGWQRPWQIQDQTTRSIRLGYAYQGGDWPWAYRAGQTFTLTDAGLEIVLDLINDGPNAMPAGLGWHPYFPRAEARLKLPVTAIWPAGDDGLGKPAQALTPGQRLDAWQTVSQLKLDNCFDTQPGAYVLEWPDHRLELQPDPLFTKAIVYVPQGEDFFCAEPVSHAPNAVNSPLPLSQTGLSWLAPGARLEGRMTLTLHPCTRDK